MLTSDIIFREITNQTKEQVPACHVHQGALQLVQGMWNVLHVNRDSILNLSAVLSVQSVLRDNSIWRLNKEGATLVVKTASPCNPKGLNVSVRRDTIC